MKSSTIKLIVLSLLFLVCSCVLNINETESYLPSEETLKKGVVNKYYLKTISKEGYAEKLDIEYRYLRTNKNGEIIEKRYNPAFKLTSKHRYKLNNNVLKELENKIVFRYGNDTIVSELGVNSEYLTFKNDTVFYKIKTIYNDNYIRNINQYARVIKDTIVNKKPAKLVERHRTIINMVNGKLGDNITLKVREIYIKDFGLWGYKTEDIKNKYELILVEQMLPSKFEKLANHAVKRVGYIDFNNTIDKVGDFKLCNKHYQIKDYYNGQENKSEFIGGKSNLKKYVFSNLEQSKLNNESGYLTFRFVINCNGESGKFVTNQSDFKYSKKQFSQETINHLYNILSNVKIWTPCIVRGKNEDSYSYITFILKNGKIEDILP